MEPETSYIYEFGGYRVVGSERQLTRDGNPVSLPPKVFDVLLTLVENHGHIVGKDQLMRRVWADTFVEDANLTVNISALRKVLSEGTNGAQFIETVPKHGYRFVAPVVEIPAEGMAAPSNAALTPVAEVNQAKEFSRLLPAEAKQDLSENTVYTHRDGSTSAPGKGSERRRRFATAAIISVALLLAGFYGWSRWINDRQSAGDAVSSPIGSIAVLPFENAVADANAEYLSDGITESLINRLSQLSGLKVTSRSSSFRYKGVDQDPGKVGAELNVTAVLTGSVKQLGDDLLITVRLEDTRTNQHIWGEQYVRKFKDILAVQNEIAQDVTSNLRIKLTGDDEQKLAKKYTQNSEAYQLYLKGNYEWNKHTQKDIEKAIEYYDQALEKDPNFALAYAGLSASYGLLATTFRPPNENFPKAKAYAAKALAIDDTLAEAHGAMGAARLLYDWDWPAQKMEFKRALALAPSYGTAHQLSAAYLESAGRFDEARSEAKRAQEIDPLSAMFGTEVGFTYYFERRYDEAIEQFDETLNLEPQWADAYQYLGQSFEQKRMYSEAIAAYQKGLALDERQPALIASLGHTYAVSGDRDKASKALAQLQELSKQQYISPYFFAVIHAGSGDKEQAFVWLERAFHDRASLLIWINVEPQFDPLRADPRFQDLIQRIGLNK
ncbi:MAG: winged helix-turn-helix domain-containing protein [Acidobacteriota bacterium]